MTIPDNPAGQRLRWLIEWKYLLAVLGLCMLLLPFMVDKEQHRWMPVIGFSTKTWRPCLNSWMRCWRDPV